MSILSFASSVAIKTTGLVAYKAAFKRYEKPNPNYVGSLCDFSYISNLTNRELIKFPSKHSNLQGYYYQTQNPKGLVIIVHGLHSVADDFLSQTLFFLSNGYNVFSYDLTGSGLSMGSWTYGLVEFLVDLDYCLDFLNRYKLTSKMNKYLFGHSMGGYACLSVLSKHREVKAVAAISAPNNGSTLIVEKGLQFVDPNLLVGKDLIMSIQKELFKDYINYDAVKGVNSVNCPILIAHSLVDMVIDFSSQSAYSHKDEITNKKVKFYLEIGSNMGHSNILYSKSALQYQKEIEKGFKAYKKLFGHEYKEELASDYYNKIDRFKYSEVNYKLMKEVLKIYKSSK